MPGDPEELVPVGGILMPAKLLNSAEAVAKRFRDIGQTAVARRQLLIEHDRLGPLTALFELFDLAQELLKGNRIRRIVGGSPEFTAATSDAENENTSDQPA